MTDGHIPHDPAAYESVDTLAEKDRDELTAEANLVRSKLLRTVEALDRKRHDALDVRLQVERHVVPIGVAGGALVVSLVAGTAIVTHRLVTMKERRRRERWQMLFRFWRHPERAAQRPGVLAQLGRSIVTGILSAAVLIPARWLLQRFYERALPPAHVRH